MREIKFRGKRVDNGEWIVGFPEFHLVDGDLTKTKQDAFITYDYMDKIGKVYRDRFNVIPETVGQFTDKTDSSGREVYEGDILECTGWENEYHVVEFMDHAFVAHKIGRPSWTVSNYTKLDGVWEFNIVGNKWDNPSLLEAN